MKTARLAALAAMALTAVLPSVAAAHPAGQSGGFAQLGTAGMFIPTPDEGEETKESAATTGTNAGISRNVKHLANLPKAVLRNYLTDIAFSGKYAIVGNYDGLQIANIEDPAKPTWVSETRCPGAQNDVSVYEHLIITSTDSQRSGSSCSSVGYNQARDGANGWEGIRIWNWMNPSQPVLVKNVFTRCGSHTHTTVPDLANDRLIVYVSSYNPNNRLTCVPPHDKISVVEVPLGDPAAAKVIDEPVLFPDGGFAGAPGRSATSGCHDITAYPAKGLALGACMGNGIVMDIKDPAKPVVLSSVTDPNYAFWHSATFSDDGRTAIFTDELGGGIEARCKVTDPGNRGANAYYDISDPGDPEFLSYFKINDLEEGRPQSAQEECVSHNGTLVPSKHGRDLMVQAWYQGGISLIDFTDPRKPYEVGFFDYATDTESDFGGGYWSAAWYNGKLYGTEQGRGLDVLNMTGPFDDGGRKLRYFNPQTQQPMQRR